MPNNQVKFILGMQHWFNILILIVVIQYCKNIKEKAQEQFKRCWKEKRTESNITLDKKK